ncbi:MAG: hypothetical protein LBB59_00565 [Campylobacteraceae bacterium]|nr:hypothetical protein [Campylobacteraceae bacterium]
MKTIIIGLILFLVSVHAGNIASFEFGEVFKDYNKYEEYINFKSNKWTSHVFGGKSKKFFNTVRIETDEKYMITLLIFQKKY